MVTSSEISKIKPQPAKARTSFKANQVRLE